MDKVVGRAVITNFTKKKILKKLGLQDERSISNILKNEGLCERILNEDVIRFSDYSKKSSLPAFTLKSFVSKALITSFRNGAVNGSPLFIFENEVAQYEPLDGLEYNDATFWTFVKNQNNTFISFLKNSNLLNQREYSLFMESLDKNYDIYDVAKRFEISPTRINQLLHSIRERLHLNIIKLKTLKELDEEILKKQAEISNLKNTILVFSDDQTQKAEIQEPALKILPLNELNITARTLNSLKAANIKYLNDLFAWKSDDLLKLNNFGNKALLEIENLLENFGFSLKSNN